MVTWEDYLIPNTSVLKNKQEIKDQQELSKVENEALIYKLSLLYLKGINGNFDSNHLRAIHHYLFDDIYYFAGSYREVDIYKQTSFLKWDLIPSELEKIMIKYRDFDFNSTQKFDIATFLANYYRDLIHIHPFREGNGRTIREFLREFTLYKFPDYVLDMTKINKKNFLMGILDYDNYPSLLAYEIYNALTEVKAKIKK